MKPRLGCLSFSGILAALLTLAVVIGIEWSRGEILFSPGPLNAQEGAIPLGGVRSHAEIPQCSDCHTAPWEPEKMSDRCQACHIDLSNDPKNFHQVMLAAGEDMGCRRCHTEHRGPNESLTALDLVHFPHNKIGFSLQAHQQMRDGSTFSCTECHGQGLAHFNIAACADCHQKLDAAFTQAHTAAFGENCTACHDGVDSYGKAFDHNQTAFALQDKHADLACNQCHAGARAIADLKSTATKCFDCHAAKDVHNGRLSQDCAACHTPTTWEDATMDHSLTAYPLVGKHGSVACKSCHLEGASGTILQGTPKDCNSCHAKEDPHAGNLSANCANCHTPSGWNQTTYDHSLAVFKLVGKHASVECKSCHTDLLFVNTPQDCFSCHSKDDPHEAKLGTNCAQCHSASGWDQATYDHSLAVFKLVGKHTSVACKDCHSDLLFVNTPQDCFSCHSKDDPHEGKLGTDCAKCHSASGWNQVNFDHSTAAFKLTGKHATTTCIGCHTDLLFVGTPKDCYSCHSKDDDHKGQFGTSCSTCHSTSGWTPIIFDHSKIAFTLTGKHATTACSGCHTKGVLKGTPTTCNACHSQDDTHKGQFGTGCSTCHSTSGWKSIIFDHSTSSFALTGKHATAACLSCHTNGVLKGTPKDCNSCHSQDDTHKGQFGAGCSTCHSTSGWKSIIFDHSKIAYTLTGKHATVACLSCHTGGVLKGTPQNCYACHSADDNHKGQYGTSCSTCHDTSGWKNATFDHSKAAFTLTGKHTTVACLSCHAQGVFKGTPQDCYSCHSQDDDHSGQFGTSCGSCHITTGWANVTFDHSTTSFALTGAHTSVSCLSCHTSGVFKGTSKDCYSCHSQDDDHAGQYGTSCGSCHSTTSWKGASVDHSLFSFKLTGQHTSVACTSCHINGVFKGTPTTCYACHTEPAYHQGVLGTDCASCHTTSGWTPASFNGSHTFPFNHGENNNTCQTCHPGSLGAYTCYGCHDAAEMKKHHDEKGITDLGNCISCHPSGNKEDGGD